MVYKVSSVNGLKGSIDLPGDKSISHRAAILGAIAKGKTEANGFLATGDCLSTLRCLAALGVEIEGVGGEKLVISGNGLKGLKEPGDVIDAGNSGTTARLLAGLLAGQEFFSIITGDDSLRQRPMDRIISPLTKMGADIKGRRDRQNLPIAINGQQLTGVEYVSPVASAQVKSSILLAGLQAKGITKVVEPHQSRDHTERMLRLMGAKPEIGDASVAIAGGQELDAAKIDIPADFSSAAFLIGGAVITPKSSLLIRQVGMNVTRTGMLDVLRSMGADLTFDNMSIRSQEARADVIINSSELRGVRVSGDIVPRLIDEIPTLAVIATQAEGETIFEDIGELRVKETDRIKAIVDNLVKLGATAEEFDDGFAVTGPTDLKGGVVKSYGDHRIAMAMAIAGLIGKRKTTIKDAKCIQISFPDFEKVLSSVTH